eukprot:874833_1
MAHVQHEETLIPLIRICRTLEVCTTNETIAFGSAFLKIILQHDDVLLQCTKTILCSLHSTLSTDIFEELSASLPRKEIDDSMSLNIIDDELPPNSIVQIPKDLLIHTFQYLDTTDIYQIEKTCRLFCSVAHDPNSLWYLAISLDSDPIENERDDETDALLYAHYHHYTHPRYSKVKILHFKDHEQGWGSHCQMMDALPQFTHIHALALNNVNPDGYVCVPKAFFKFIGMYLQTLQLSYISIETILGVITRCKHVETLILDDILCDDNDDLVVNQWSFGNSDSTEYPMPYLQTLAIERWSSFGANVQRFVYWILANGCDKKTFSVCDHHDMHQIENDPRLYILSDSDLFDSKASTHALDQLQQKALINVSKLMLHVYDCYLVDNISTWLNRCKNIKFDEFIMDPIHMYSHGTLEKTSDELIKPMHNIASRSVRSSFCWSPEYSYCINRVDKWYVDNVKPFLWNTREEKHVQMKKHKWILHDWPNAILTHDISRKFHCFDNITLCLDIIESLDCVDDAKTLFESVIKPWIHLKQSPNKPYITYNLFVNVPRNWIYQVKRIMFKGFKSLFKDYQVLMLNEELYIRECTGGIRIRF